MWLQDDDQISSCHSVPSTAYQSLVCADSAVLTVLCIIFCCRAFDVELLYIAQQLGMPIREVAVNWQEIEGVVVSGACGVVVTSSLHTPQALRWFQCSAGWKWGETYCSSGRAIRSEYGQFIKNRKKIELLQ